MKKASSTTNLIACITIIGAVAVGFATGPAFAETEPSKTAFEFKFSYAPSELQSASGVKNLLTRLEDEVRDRCTPEGRLTNEQRIRSRLCIHETMQTSVEKFASTRVAQAYDVRAGG